MTVCSSVEERRCAGRATCAGIRGSRGDEAERVMDAYAVKYGFRHPPPFWRLTPRRAFAWTDLGKDATRWVLPTAG